MRRKLLIVLSSVVAILILLAFVLLKQSPLEVDGITNENEYKTIILGLKNKGIFSVQLQEVWVNNQAPQKVELGISKSLHLVLGGLLDDDPNIRFIPITQEKIAPKIKREKLEQALKDGAPINYGLRMSHNEPIEHIKVKYKYFGLTYTKHITLNK